MAALAQPVEEGLDLLLMQPAKAPSLPAEYDAGWSGHVFFRADDGGFHGFPIGHYSLPAQKEMLFWLGHLVAINSSTQAIGYTTKSIQAVRRFMRFLQVAAPAVRKPQDFTPDCVRRFAAWLREQKQWTHQYRGKTFNLIVGLFKQLRVFRPELVSSDLPTARFGKRAYRPAKAIQSLSFETGAEIERACLEHVQAFFSRWQKAQALIAEARAAGVDESAPITFQDSLGVVLLKLRRSLLACISTVSNPQYVRAFSGISRGHHRSPDLPIANISELVDLLLPSAKVIFPFYLLVAARLGANTSSIFDLEVDCLAPPSAADLETAPDSIKRAAAEGRVQYVTWFKQKVRQVHALPFGDAPHHPPQVINQVMEITADLRKVARPARAVRVFLYRCGGNADPARKFSSATIHLGMKQFRKDHPNLSRFTVPQFRKRFTDAAIVAAKGNIFAAAAVIHHSSAQVTQEHYMGTIGRAVLDTILARFAHYFQRLIELATPDKPLRIRIHEISVGKPLPKAEPKPDGALVSTAIQFAAAFENSSLILNAGDPEVWARIIQFHEHLVGQRSADNALRWEECLRPLVRFIAEDLMPHMPPSVRERAVAMAGCLPPLPNFE